jgi:hypothetical protein
VQTIERGRRTKLRRTVPPKISLRMDSLGSLPGQDYTNLSTSPQTHRVSTSPRSGQPVSDDPSGGEDVFSFENKSPCQPKKKAQWEHSLDRERTFFAELDKTQKLRVEDAVSTPSALPAIVLRAPKFIFRPNLQRR